MSGKEMSVEEVMEEVRQDKAFYDRSGGGVTLSGGEVLCHLPFAVALAKACRAEGISVALETNFSLPYEQIKPLLDEVNVVMADIKLFDDELHKRYTGGSNEHVLKNIAALKDIPLVVRTPLIPGVTDTIENLRAIAAFLVPKRNLLYYQLLGFNPLGDSKYQGLDIPNAFADAHPYTDAQMRTFGEWIADIPLKVKVGE